MRLDSTDDNSEMASSDLSKDLGDDSPNNLSEEKEPTSSPVLTTQKNWVKRVIFGTILISGFLLLIFLGPIVIILSALTVQVLCFSEIITIGYKYNKIPNLPYFRSICWYFVGAANYFFGGEMIRHHFQGIYQKHHYFQMLISYHRFISFCLYFSGIILFVLSLVRKYDLRQFGILAWTHTLLIIIVVQSYLAIENIFQGLIYFILPISLVILNDIFAYVFGRLYGKTPLIKLSPNKTWEGFIGGGVGAFVIGLILSQLMCKFKYFTCPIEYVETSYGIALNTDCAPDYLFQPHNYHLFSFISIDFYPFFWDFLAFFLFASIIAPFGGFCASGFKRAFKVKNFGEVIPGHGGIMDRFDCQFLMVTFVNVYIFSFVRNTTVEKVFQKVLYLEERNQLEFYNMLQEALISSGLITDYVGNQTMSCII